MDNLRIEAERIGLPATATTAQMLERIYELPRLLEKSEAERKKWQARAEDLQAQSVEDKKAVKQRDELECDLLLEKARAYDKIDESDMQFYRDLYKLSREKCIERLDSLRERSWLRNQESLKNAGTDPPSDVMSEFAIKVQEQMKLNKGISEAEAGRRVFKANKGMFQRVQEARRIKAGTNGDGGDK